MAFRVFVSHSTRDISLVDQLQYWLELNGIETYLAELYPQPGQNISEKVKAAILDSDCVLGILTANGLRSEWVHHEIGEARMAGKLVIPLVDKTLPPPSYLGDRECIFFDPYDPAEAINLLVAYLDRQKTAKEMAASTRAAVLATGTLTIGLLALAAATRGKE